MIKKISRNILINNNKLFPKYSLIIPDKTIHQMQKEQ